MPKAIDLTGQRFGRLVTVRRTANSPHGKVQWLCTCDCGRTHTASSNLLRQGKVNSCGCLRREVSSKKLRRGRVPHRGDTVITKRACRHCGRTFGARRCQYYCGEEACWRESRTRKRLEQRRSKAQIDAAIDIARLNRRL